ncbi:MAG: shikimate kinase [Gemmatimonadaceae bacterium]
MASEKHIVLVGLPGVGKTTVGRAVANRLGREFFDLDTLIEHSFGKSISQIFRDHGEAVFRATEAKVTGDVAGMAPVVIAPGGGWVVNSAAVAHLLEASRIIYLRVSPDAAIRRMGRGIDRRPLLSGVADPFNAMRDLYAARKPVYERYADITVETGGIERSTVIAKVLGMVLAAERDFTLETEDGND